MTYNRFFLFISLLLEPRLIEVNDAQIYMRQSGLAFDQCVQKLKALTLFCEEKCDLQVAEAAKRAIQDIKHDIFAERKIGR